MPATMLVRATRNIRAVEGAEIVILLPESSSSCPIPRPRPLASCYISRVGQATAVDRQAATADALGKPGPQALQFGYALVDALCPLPRQSRPIPTRGHAFGWQLGELGADLLKRQPNALRENDEGDPANTDR
ncbi:hypothetical protein AJ87_34785 [Rhizobium yanglingense]|nr:hypothetical protein AJ87_34785 [Rhizobium yanglingense]